MHIVPVNLPIIPELCFMLLWTDYYTGILDISLVMSCDGCGRIHCLYGVATQSF